VSPPPPNQPPAGDFMSICSGLDCNFTSTSSDPDGSVASYAWTFGDGGTSTLPSPSHAYAAGGSYPVSLTVTDNQSAQSSPTSKTVTVTVPPPAPEQPPTGPHQVRGVVFEDLDGDGVQYAFGGEMGLAGWTLTISWNGQVFATTTSDADGNYVFADLGNTGSGAFEVCIQVQPGYTQTSPVGGTGCGGAGFSAPFNNSSMTWFRADFAEMLQLQ
jgi:PKD repeat protein